MSSIDRVNWPGSLPAGTSHTSPGAVPETEKRDRTVSRFERPRVWCRWIILGVFLLVWVGRLAGGTGLRFDGTPAARRQVFVHAARCEQGDSNAGPAAPRDAAALAEGQALFRGLCSGCHGGAGRGGKGPDLTDNRWIHGGTDKTSPA